MALFDIPEGYSCIVRTSDTQLSAYKNNQRHTYIVNGIEWEHTSTQTNVTIPTNSVCVTSPQIPSNALLAMLLLGGAIALCTFKMIFNIMKRSFL